MRKADDDVLPVAGGFVDADPVGNVFLRDAEVSGDAAPGLGSGFGGEAVEGPDGAFFDYVGPVAPHFGPELGELRFDVDAEAHSGDVVETW